MKKALNILGSLVNIPFFIFRFYLTELSIFLKVSSNSDFVFIILLSLCHCSSVTYLKPH